MNSKFQLGSRSLALLWLAFVLIVSALLLKQWLGSTHLPIETNILKLLPKNQQDKVAEQAFKAVSTSMSDRVIFVLSSQDREKLLQAARTFEKGLLETQQFTNVIGEISPDKQQAWASYYFNHRFQQLTQTQRDRLNQDPQAQIQHVLQALYNPFSGVTSQELQSDPFLLFRDYLSQVKQQTSAFTLDSGYLFAKKDGQQYLLITAILDSSPYSFSTQLVVSKIEQLEQSIATQFNTKTAHTGALFYASYGTQNAKHEITTIGAFSLLGIIVLLLIVFRSLSPIGLALLSISVGLLVALSVTILVFGKVHLFSLVFGASLIGVSIDYAFHYLTERLSLGHHWDSREGLKHIFVAITLGLATSLIGYITMLIAPFPGLQQLALFSSIGLIAAYTTVVAWYPVLAKQPSHNVANVPAKKLLSAWLSAWQYSSVKIGLPIICLVSSGYLLTQLEYNDDIRQLQAMPEALKKQETLITEVSGMQASQQMLVVTANSEQSLLERLEQLDSKLNQWRHTNIVESYQNLSNYLSSIERQQKDFALIKNLYQTQGPTLASDLQLLTTPILNASFVPVSLTGYLNNPVSEPIRFLYLGQIEGKSAAIIMLNQLNKPDVVKSFVQTQPDISYLDKAEEISSLFRDYRIKIMELLFAAAAIIFSVLVKRYGFNHGWRIILPSVIACICGLAAAVAAGSTLNLFNLLGLVLILGIGIDYTLFFAEKSHSLSTLLAITLSAITTILSFGLLALSQTHAIHSFGITVLSGIFVAWLLSPIAIITKEKPQ